MGNAQPFTGHSRGVTSVSCDPSGKYLASGSRDNTVKIWDTKTGKCLHTFTGHSHCVFSVSWDPSGTYLASGSDDKTLKLWDLDKALHPKPKAKPAPQKPKPAPQPKPQQPHVSASTPTQQLDVALPDGTHIQLEAGLSAQIPIAAVKGMVSAKTGLDFASLCLVFNGLKLEDTRNLASYKIHNGTQLHAVVTRADADEAGANPQQGGVAKEDTTTKTQELHAQHHANIATARRKLLGCGFKDVRATRVLGTGCNGAVLEGVSRDIPVALKIMYNYGANTTLVGSLQATEYRFLQRVPEHFNIGAVLGVVPA